MSNNIAYGYRPAMEQPGIGLDATMDPSPAFNLNQHIVCALLWCQPMAGEGVTED